MMSELQTQKLVTVDGESQPPEEEEHLKVINFSYPRSTVILNETISQFNCSH